MTVNPGFAGQKLLPSMLEKITQARAYLDERGFSNVDLEVDGIRNSRHLLLRITVRFIFAMPP